MLTSHLMLIARPSFHVREVKSQDGAILLDIRKRRCVSLTPEAARVWGLLKLNYSLDQIVTHLVTELHEPPQQTRDEILEFLDVLSKLELLDTAAPDRKAIYRQRVIRSIHRCSRLGDHWLARRCVGPPWLFGKATAMLLIFDLLRLRKNFVDLYQFVRDWPISRRPAIPGAIDRVITAVNYACVFYPNWVRCLQRSATTTCLLRSLGVQAQMVIGAQTVPFNSHAWTEVDGLVIDERADDPSTPLVLDRL